MSALGINDSTASMGANTASSVTESVTSCRGSEQITRILARCYTTHALVSGPRKPEKRVETSLACAGLPPSTVSICTNPDGIPSTRYFEVSSPPLHVLRFVSPSRAFQRVFCIGHSAWRRVAHGAVRGVCFEMRVNLGLVPYSRSHAISDVVHSYTEPSCLGVRGEPRAWCVCALEARGRWRNPCLLWFFYARRQRHRSYLKYEIVDLRWCGCASKIRSLQHI